VSLVRHGSAYTLGQEDVPGKGHEIQAVHRLVADRDLSGTVTTMDALLTQRSIAELILRLHDHYLMVVRAYRPELYNAITLLFKSPPVPVVPGEVQAFTYPGKDHGRREPAPWNAVRHWRRTLTSSGPVSPRSCAGRASASTSAPAKLSGKRVTA
jgi:hypothetical protein